MSFNIRLFADSFTAGVLLSLSIYHLLIYLGRSSHRFEKNNLYFSVYLIGLIINIFFDNTLAVEFIKNDLLRGLIAPFGVVLGSFISMTAVIIILYKLLIIPKIFKVVFYLCIIVLLTALILTLSTFIIGWQRYMDNVDIYVFALFQSVHLVMQVIFLFYFFKNHIYSDKNKLIIFIGFQVIDVFITINRIILISDYTNYNRNNYFFIGILVFVFVYVLSLKFNSEFKELVVLKNELENKVIERTEALMNAKNEIEKLGRQKIDFFIKIAHEVKTPLTLIDNYLKIDIAERGESKPINIVKENVYKLKKDIINFLDLEKVNLKKSIYNHDKIVDFSVFLNKAVLFFKEIIKNKNLDFNYKIDKNIFIKIAPDALDRIIYNLIDNAFKYTKEGRIDISLNRKDNKIFLTVYDTGIGISKDQQDNVFKPYYQISNNESNLQGIGMGLFIVKSILVEVNGKIIINSEKHKGTEIKVVFNEYHPDKNDAIVSEYDNKEIIMYDKKYNITEDFYDASKKTILIIENNIDMLNFLHESMKKKYNIYMAENGKSGLSRLNLIQKPDLIISDIMMDVMDGNEFYNKILNDKRYTDIPVVFLTAKADDDVQIKSLRSGAVDFINKPFDIEVLSAKIDSIIKNIEKQRKRNLEDFYKKLSAFINKSEKKNNIFDLFKTHEINQKEIDVIELILKGFEYKEISAELNLTLSGVKKRINGIYKKLNVQNKVELINLLNNTDN